MIKRYNNLSLSIAIPGIITQIAGRFLMAEQPTIGAVLALVGTGLLLVGFAFYAKAKGRNPAWCLMAFLSIIGLVVLAMLKDQSGVDEV